MALGRLLPAFLRQGEEGPDEGEAEAEAERATETGAEGTIIHECRHCGTDFDERCDRCPVCGATEIATYEFGPGPESATESTSTSESESTSSAEE